jgi:hypothetical protein
VAIRRTWAGPISSRARHTVVSEATGPNTSCWWRSTSISARSQSAKLSERRSGSRSTGWPVCMSTMMLP